MTLRKIIIATAITAVAALGTIGSASAAKDRFERVKPHTNVGSIAITATTNTLTTGQ